jgi:RNA polymerase sigma-70 factor (ECF subfamily)
MTGLSTESAPFSAVAVTGDRLERAVRENFQFIWRSLRRLGVRPDDAVDDAAQRVFELAARRATAIEPGRERAFFFMTALKVAHESRRRDRRESSRFGGEAVDTVADPAPDPEQATADARLRQLFDAVLSEMPIELRAVFVLFELEGLSSSAIAQLLELPVGTVASRLRRAREHFRERAAKLDPTSPRRGAR